MPHRGCSIPIELRFWSKVDRNGPPHPYFPELGNCWIWIGAVVAPGAYGQISVNGKTQLAHVVAWRIHSGKIPIGQLVLHTCDRKPCVNYAHLYLGTKSANMNDALKRGQAHYGERTPGAVLTEIAVKQIRSFCAEGIPQYMLAQKFDVSRAEINNIVKRKRWKHIA